MKSPIRHHRQLRLAAAFSASLVVSGFTACSTNELAGPGAGASPGDKIINNRPKLYETRIAAEWEPVAGCLVAWPLHLPRELLQEIVKKEFLVVVVKDHAAEADARETFTKWNINLSNVKFVAAAQSDGHYGTRDWGAFSLFNSAGNMSLVDGKYVDYPLSGFDPGTIHAYLSKIEKPLSFAHDDAAPAKVAELLGLERLELPISLTGGNVYTDGHGIAFATAIILPENRDLKISDDEFFTITRDRLGISNFYIVPNFEAIFGAQHIDCVMKLLDEERIIVKEVAKDNPDYAGVEAVVQKLRSLTNVYGRPYQILRIKTTPYNGTQVPAYTNSLILNKRIFVPLFGVDSDEPALATWREAMPGYEVIGIPQQKKNAWTYTDALHCRTKAIWDAGMLYLRHRRFDAIVKKQAAYPVEVTIRDYSKTGLRADSLRVYYRSHGESVWRSEKLVASDRVEIFNAKIPDSAGPRIEYYISAEDGSGRRETLPRTAPAGFYEFKIER
ncbi:MAG: agmatine deiminase family protein [Planctomycetota bacterium]